MYMLHTHKKYFNVFLHIYNTLMFEHMLVRLITLSHQTPMQNINALLYYIRFAEH